MISNLKLNKKLGVLIICVFLMCSCSPAERETVIIGQVLDEATGSHLNDVCVVLYGLIDHGLIKGGEVVDTYALDVDEEGNFSGRFVHKEIDVFILKVFVIQDGRCVYDIENEISLEKYCSPDNCNNIVSGKKHILEVKVITP
jgi:hypothetical protein